MMVSPETEDLLSAGRLPYAGLVSLSRDGGNLGTRPPKYRAIARSAAPGLSRILGTKPSYDAEETTMMHYTTAQALGQVRLAELHHQAQRDALARAARRARRARRQHATQRTTALRAALTRRARHPGAAPGSA
jgi:hypothetical protein